MEGAVEAMGAYKTAKRKQTRPDVPKGSRGRSSSGSCGSSSRIKRRSQAESGYDAPPKDAHEGVHDLRAKILGGPILV
jgi:hypothetical protein